MAIDNRENWYHLYDVREQFIFKMTKEKWDPPPPKSYLVCSFGKFISVSGL